MGIVSTWLDVGVKLQSALATAAAIDAITQANPGVVTDSAHGLSNGAWVKLSVEGMSELDGRVVRVANASANTFELEGIDTSNFDAFTSGSYQVITYGTNLTVATGVNASGGDANFIGVGVIHDKQDRQIPGLQSPASFEFECLWDPGDAGLAALKEASDNQTQLAVRLDFPNGRRVAFTGYISASMLPTGSFGEAVKTPVTVTMFGRPSLYTS